jgi:hypothetical protein
VSEVGFQTVQGSAAGRHAAGVTALPAIELAAARVKALSPGRSRAPAG